ncbi:MAG: 2-hydroxychromene-2-carboxylate isomerase [Alphaproteobacteria bacterium]|nr:2-hydroxychromene-2-carboxylate isomerase [Alphaproteobacteria bacterium]
MSAPIEYYYSHLSPWTYLGHQRLLDLAARAGREITFMPVDIATIFAQSGGVPVAQRPIQRKRYRMAELRRWREALGVELNLEPTFFPRPDQPAARIAIAAQRAGADLGAFSLALMRGCWVEESDLTDEATLTAIADESAFDGAALLADSRSDAVSEIIAENTRLAKERDMFGAPWYVVDGERFWGQDRLDFVARRLGVEPA